MSSSGLFWTGALNAPHAFTANVGFYDTTLRDGEQTVGVVLDPEDKLELARGLDKLGIERIEAGFPRVSQDDWRAVELIRDAGLNAEVWGFSRAVEADVKALVELGIGASVIESPISDLKLEALGVDREAMLERIVCAISFAVEQGITVAFFGVDGTRADPGYFETVYKTAIEAGAQEAVVVDTIGIASPEAVADLVGRTKEWLGPTCRSTSTVTTTSASPPPLRSLRCGRARPGSREPSTAWASVRAMRTFRRSHSRCAALYGVETNLRLDRARGVLGAAARAVGLRARAVQAAGRRQPLSPRVGRRREPVPRSAGDRAVLVRARRRASGASCSARRAASTRSASRRRSSGSISPTTRSASCSCESRSSARRNAGSSPTTSSASSRMADYDAVLVGSGINSLACAAFLSARRLARRRART